MQVYFIYEYFIIRDSSSLTEV